MPHPVPAQPRRKLTADLIPRAPEVAAPGRPLALIADALSVHRGTLHRWRTEADSEGLERDLADLQLLAGLQSAPGPAGAGGSLHR